MRQELNQARFVSVLSDMGKDYASLLLGAGASRSSGVPLAREIVHDIVATEYCHQTGIPVGQKQRVPATEVRSWLELQNWFRDARARGESEYSAVFREFKPTHDHQIRYISSLLQGASPSPAYRALSDLVRERFFPVVVTTNFDPLLENCYRGKFPTEASLRTVESPEGFKKVTVESGRVILGHLHGNLNGYDIANLDEATSLLKEDVAQALTRLLNPFALVVMGYSGNDGSVMSLLEQLARDESALGRGVIYWCHIAGNKISPRVAALLDSVQSGFSVEISGFDQLIKALAERFGVGVSEFRSEPPTDIDGQGDAVGHAAAVNVALTQSLPAKLLRFRTGLKSRQDIYEMRGEHDWWQGTIVGDEFWMLGNPAELPADLIESISAKPTEVILSEASLEDDLIWRVFVELANKGLDNMLRKDLSLRWFRGKRYFFGKPRNDDERKVTYKSRKMRATRRVVWKAFTRGEGADETVYYVHEALRTDISRFGGRPCLVIRPTRLFTISGNEVWDTESARSSVGRSTSKVWNEPYDSLVRLWLEVLSKNSDRITVRFSADGRKPEYRLEFNKRPLEAQKIRMT